MKTKILSFLMISFLIGLFTSCEGPMGPEGPAGEGITWRVFPMTVKGDHWQWDADREAYYYFFEESQISKFVATDGLVQVAIEDGDAYYPLPYTRHLYDNDFITETVSYEYGPGWIRFNFSASDLFDNTPNNYKPGTHTFKVTLLW